MTFRLFAGLAGLTLLASCAATQLSPSGSRPITKDFGGTSIDWRGASGETVLVYKLFQSGTVTEVCGAIMTTGTQTVRNLELQLLVASRLEVYGTKIADNLRFFSRVAPQDETALANCAVTGVPWEPSFETATPELKSRTRDFYY